MECVPSNRYCNELLREVRAGHLRSVQMFELQYSDRHIVSVVWKSGRTENIDLKTDVAMALAADLNKAHRKATERAG